jgi:hypothetical protein
MSAAVRPGSGEGRKMKDHLASWRLSAYPGANARRRKVIGGRIYDEGGFLSTDHRDQPLRKMREANGSDSTLVAILCAGEIPTAIGDGLILAGKWSVSPVKER